MPKPVNDILYIPFQVIVDLSLNSEGRIRNLISQGHPNFQAIPDPEDKRRKLIKYDSLNQKYKDAITTNIGDPYAIVQSEKIQREAQLLTQTNHRDISEFWEIDFKEHKAIQELDFWDRTDPKFPLKVIEIAKACAICKWFQDVKPSKVQQYGYDSKPALQEAIQNHDQVKPRLDDEGNKIGGMQFFWSANFRHFQRAFTAYKNEGWVGLVPKNLGQRNNVKIETEQQKETLTRLFASWQNRDLVWVADEYNKIGKLYGWPEISERTVRNYAKDEGIQVQGTAFRNGTKGFRNQVLPVIHRDRPSRPGYLWEGDGSPWELYFKKVQYKDGKKKTTYWNRKVVYLITDAYNDLPVGWAIGETESAELILQAWKNAILNTGMMPWQIRMDNFAKKTLQDYYEKIAVYFTPAGVGNPRAKLIEQVFSRFSGTRILKQYPNWSGCNITNRTESNQPNREFLDREKAEFPDEETIIPQINHSLNEFRQAVIKKIGMPRFESWIEALKETQKVRLAGHQELIDIFGVYRRDTYQFTNEGLTMIINGKERHWMNWKDTDDKVNEYMELYGARELRVKYLPEDLNVIRVDHPVRKKVYYLPIDVHVPGCIMDMKDSPEGRDLLYQKLRFHKALTGEVVARHEKTIQVTDDMMVQTSVEAQGILKSMFTLDGTNKGYLNDAKNFMKSLETTIERAHEEDDLYDHAIDEGEELTVSSSFDEDLYD
jgi:hypothetical protein